MSLLKVNHVGVTKIQTIGKYFVFLLLGMILLSGCMATHSVGNIPQWVDSLYDAKYNEKTFLCAVGSGSTRETAVDAALASLSQVFNSQVKSITSFASVSTATDDGQGLVKFSESSSMLDQGSVTSSTDRIIGAQVVNTWIDANARIYVRVAVDRKRTSDLYQKDIQELGASIAHLKISAQMSNDLLSQYFILREAVRLAKQQQGFIDQVQVLTGQKISSLLAPLQMELAQTAAKIQILVHAEVFSNEDALNALEMESTQERLVSAFSNQMNELGFTVFLDKRTVPVNLEIIYSVTPIVQTGSPYQYARYELSVQLKSEGRVLVSYQKAEREAALSTKDALQRALRQALATAVPEFSTLMQKELVGE
jgi:hypothetical protein